jgi:FdrA protein
MTVLRAEIRSGAYHDSIVLMQLQAALAKLPGVRDAGAVMGTRENVALLAASGLHLDTASATGLPEFGPEDLVIVVQADDEDAAIRALGQIDDLLAERRRDGAEEFRPRSLDSALERLPSASWALVSVPGRFAAAVARDALERGLHVFLYSDNVEPADEVSLKREAATRGLLLMGPDCGTAIINGTGFGFTNRVRRGAIGLIGASGTGLQAISCRIHALGGGVSQALGTGGRDLHADVGAITARQAMSLLSRDPETEVIVIVSKPPDEAVAHTLMSAAREAGKPVIVHFLDHIPPAGAGKTIPVRFATSLSECAELAVRLAGSDAPPGIRSEPSQPTPTEPAPSEPAPSEPAVLARDRREPVSGAAGGRYLRGLFAGGTLALEATRVARAFLPSVHSNVSLERVSPLADPTRSREHTILDLGADEFTVGRLHPMMDNELRLRRIAQETEDTETGVILLDVVLGDGAHPDPAAELAPAIELARSETDIEFAMIVIGTEDDPQDLAAQIDRLTEAGARVFADTSEAVRFAARRLGAEAASSAAAGPTAADSPPPDTEHPPGAGLPPDTDLREVDLDVLRTPVAAVNLGVRTFHDSLLDQGATAVHVEWRPPAGGDEKLMSILEKLRD